MSIASTSELSDDLDERVDGDTDESKGDPSSVDIEAEVELSHTELVAAAADRKTGRSAGAGEALLRARANSARSRAAA
jgi:hypothetical protein